MKQLISLLLFVTLLPVLAQGDKPVPDAQGYYPASSSWRYFRVAGDETTRLPGRNESKESSQAVVEVGAGHLLEGRLVTGEPHTWLRCELDGNVVYFPAHVGSLKAAESGPGVGDKGDYFKRFRDLHVWYRVVVNELNARRSSAGALDLSNERSWPALLIGEWPVYTTYHKGDLVAAVALVSDTQGQSWFAVEGRPNRWQMFVRANSRYLQPVAGPAPRWGP